MAPMDLRVSHGELWRIFSQDATFFHIRGKTIRPIRVITIGRGYRHQSAKTHRHTS